MIYPIDSPLFPHCFHKGFSGFPHFTQVFPQAMTQESSLESAIGDFDYLPKINCFLRIFVKKSNKYKAQSLIASLAIYFINGLLNIL